MKKPVLITDHEQRIAKLELQIKTQAQSIEELVTDLEKLQTNLANIGYEKNMQTSELLKKLENYKEQLHWSLDKEKQLKEQLFKTTEKHNLALAEIEQLKAEIAKFSGLQERRIRNCIKGYNKKVEEIVHLKAEIAQLTDTPGGKRLYSQMNLINELRNWCAKLEAALEDYWGKDSGHPVLETYRAWKNKK